MIRVSLVAVSDTQSEAVAWLAAALGEQYPGVKVVSSELRELTQGEQGSLWQADIVLEQITQPVLQRS